MPMMISFCCAPDGPANPNPIAAPVASTAIAAFVFLIATLLTIGRPAAGLLLRLFDCGGDHLGVGAEPVGLGHELPALDLEDLHPAAAFVVLGGDLQRRNEA